MAKYQGPIVDVDVHHGWKTPAEVIAYLPKEWREYAQGGARLSGGSSVVAGNTPNSAMRADAFPEDGSFPGSDYPLLKEQLLDRYDYWRGVLTFNVGAHAGLSHLVGGTAALTFAVALFASGISSSSVGTYAGQVVMAGFVNLRLSVFVRRGLTMIPALVVLAIGVSPTSALVLSQVVLSFGIPFALVPLLLLTSRRDVMGSHVNRLPTIVVAGAIALLISALNLFLLAQAVGLS